MDWPPLTPGDIVAKAREYVGTPWHHCGRVKGAGVDCVGLIACTLLDLGVPVVDATRYTLGDEFDRMVTQIAAHADHVAGTWRAGDCLVFRNVALPPPYRILNHVGIYNGEGGMIHSWNASPIRRVAEHPLNDFWQKSIVAVYRYRGVVS